MNSNRLSCHQTNLEILRLTLAKFEHVVIKMMSIASCFAFKLHFRVEFVLPVSKLKGLFVTYFLSFSKFFFLNHSFKFLSFSSLPLLHIFQRILIGLLCLLLPFLLKLSQLLLSIISMLPQVSCAIMNRMLI